MIFGSTREETAKLRPQARDHGMKFPSRLVACFGAIVYWAMLPMWEFPQLVKFYQASTGENKGIH